MPMDFGKGKAEEKPAKAMNKKGSLLRQKYDNNKPLESVIKPIQKNPLKWWCSDLRRESSAISRPSSLPIVGDQNST